MRAAQCHSRSMKKPIIYFTSYETPCGPLRLASYGDALCLCDWGKDSVQRDFVLRRVVEGIRREEQRGSQQMTIEAGRTEILHTAIEQLEEYFGGIRHTFTLPLRLFGTPFQLQVWQALAEVPYGTTYSYTDIAQRIGSPRAVRAVANAMRANALSIFLPCHRIIGRQQALTGYAGGLEAKHHLLTLEREWREMAGL